MNSLKKVLNVVYNAVFPPHIKCVFCDDELAHKKPTETCDKCEKLLPYKTGASTCQKCGDKVEGFGAVCLVCKSRPRHFEKAASPFFYKAPVSNLVKKLKYNNAKYLAQPLAAFLAWEFYKHNFDVDGVVFVPMTIKAQKARGYNQAHLLAQSFCSLVNLPLFESALVKHKHTVRQTELDLDKRKKNIENTFKVVNKKQVKSKRLLLIDDVLTSGATATEISKTLLQAGADKVFVLTVARTFF